MWRAGMFVSALLEICESRGSQYREDRTFVVEYIYGFVGWGGGFCKQIR